LQIIQRRREKSRVYILHDEGEDIRVLVGAINLCDGRVACEVISEDLASGTETVFTDFEMAGTLASADLDSDYLDFGLAFLALKLLTWCLEV
jgi:hypothetical protein